MKTNEFISYANSFQTVINLGLQRISNLLSHIDNPQNKLKFIHIAGTNGKGSVCSFLQSILIKEGYKVGKFISPSMLKVNERISINNEDISTNVLENLITSIEKKCVLTQNQLGEIPSQFEIWVAVAMQYFYENKCDIVVLETGLGGQFDATNVIPTPLASIITRIDLDHTNLLGDTIEKIAHEKAGIIKENGITITLPHQKKLLEPTAKGNQFYLIDQPKIHAPSYINEVFSYKNLPQMTCGISGEYQVENACLAIETALQIGISHKSIIYGIESAKNIGRFELLSKNPIVIFDGAHNISGIKGLTTSLNRYFKNREVSYIMAFMGDKDIKGILSQTKGTKYYFTKVKNNERATNQVDLHKIAAELGIKGAIDETIEQAYNKAVLDGNIVVICGSLYLYKDFFDFFTK